MIIQEETRGQVESDEHIDGVMLVGTQDEEYSKEVHDPGKRV